MVKQTSGARRKMVKGIGSQTRSWTGVRTVAKAGVTTGTKKTTKAKTSKNIKGVVVGAAIGVAVAGGAGMAVYEQTIKPATEENYVLTEYEKDENGDSVYKVTSYRLNKAKQALEELSVRKNDITPSAYNNNGLVPDGWKDIDGNGCDTRYDVLAGSLVNMKTDGKCKVSVGEMFDFYTGQVISYESGIDIDHIVAKKNAWDSGGYKWNSEQWETYVNDAERVLMATSDSANRSKQDKDAADWLPPNQRYWCNYVIKQIEVKSYYGLSVREAEREKMKVVLDRNCKIV